MIFHGFVFLIGANGLQLCPVRVLVALTYPPITNVKESSDIRKPLKPALGMSRCWAFVIFCPSYVLIIQLSVLIDICSCVFTPLIKSHRIIKGSPIDSKTTVKCETIVR
jgi:hypothetical protein